MDRTEEAVATLSIFQLCSYKGNIGPLYSDLFQYYKFMHDWWAFGAPPLIISRTQLLHLPPALPSLLWFWNKRMRFCKHNMLTWPSVLILLHTFKWFVFIMFPSVRMIHCIYFSFRILSEVSKVKSNYMVVNWWYYVIKQIY